MKATPLKTKGFSFKQFSIEGGQSGMPVSTDGVMLGAWADIEPAERILDIGTGTGLLALMCAQRQPHAHVTAVDIEPNAIAAAQHNVTNSAWQARIEILEGDILSMPLTGSFDAIVCNPPYFNSGEQSQHQQRATARHTDRLSHQALIARCAELLTPNGCASFVLPDSEGEAFIRQAEQSGWFVTRLCRVRPSDTKPVHRLLFELARSAVPCQVSELTIRENLDYSQAFIELTREFYLKM
ncbi:tRNA1(Val) (adenine(37)-N6)-methyltransferase [Vibrio proteolyticus]